MCIGLMDDGGTNPLIDLTQHPWTVLGKKNIQPLNPDLIAEIHRRWNKYFASVDGGDYFTSQGPRPSQWKTPKLMKWLTTNPINDEWDIAFLTKTAQMRSKLASHAAESKKKANVDLDDGDRAWHGCKPMLRVIEALVQNDDSKMLYLKRRHIDRGREAVDGRNSVEKRAVTCWEIIADSWNDPGFNPTTEIITDLHSDFMEEIDLSHSCVAAYHEATPEYVEKRFQGMIVDLKRGIANWEKSGAGDGGHDEGDGFNSDAEENDGGGVSRGYEEGHELFGSIRGRNRDSLCNRHAYFQYSKSYVLYAWHMLEKHGLLRNSFQMLNASKSSGDGAYDVPTCVYEFDHFGDDTEDNSHFTQRSTVPRRKTTADKASHDAVAGLNRLGQSLNKMSKSSERSAKITADSSNMQNLCSTIESLESRRTQLVLLKLDRMDNPAAIAVIDSEIDKINERLIERVGEYNALTT